LMSDVREHRVASAAYSFELRLITNDLHLPLIDRCGARNDGGTHVATLELLVFCRLRIAFSASPQNRAARHTRALAVLRAGFQHIAAESTDRFACVDAEQARRLRIEIADHSRAIDCKDAFDDTAQYGLRLDFAPAQRIGQLDEIVPHVLHRPCEL